MRVQWAYQRCILCLNVNPLTDEHIIPDQIGGKFVAEFLCKTCNSRLGQNIESRIKEDPAIRLAVENLRYELPDLTRTILDNQIYIGAGEGGIVHGKFKSDSFQVNSSQNEDLSIIQSTHDGRKHIENALRKDLNSNETIVAALDYFDHGPDNQELSLTPWLAATKWRIDRIEPALDGQPLLDLVLLKIAYDFAACHLGVKVYDSSSQLNEIRDALRSSPQSADFFSIENFMIDECDPVHGLALTRCNEHVVVVICLFGRLRYHVHLYHLNITPPFFKYSHFLKNGKESCMLLDDKQ